MTIRRHCSHSSCSFWHGQSVSTVSLLLTFFQSFSIGFNSAFSVSRNCYTVFLRAFSCIIMSLMIGYALREVTICDSIIIICPYIIYHGTKKSKFSALSLNFNFQKESLTSTPSDITACRQNQANKTYFHRWKIHLISFHPSRQCARFQSLV